MQGPTLAKKIIKWRLTVLCGAVCAGMLCTLMTGCAPAPPPPPKTGGPASTPPGNSSTTTTSTQSSDTGTNTDTDSGNDLSAPTFANVRNFLDQLTNIDVNAIGNTKYQMVVMDYIYGPGDPTKGGWTPSPDQIQALKNSPGGPKLIVCYLSIGEAAKYRWYWDSSWIPPADPFAQSANAPSWLGPVNPAWGSLNVRYWDPLWQQIVFKSLDKIVSDGYDGVFLDVVNAYEYWGPGGRSGVNRATAEQEMVDFVTAIANRARQSNSDFGVFPNGGYGLGSHPEYVNAVTGICSESVWTVGDIPQPAAGTATVIGNLQVFKDAGKTVLTISYATAQNVIDEFYAKAKAQGFVPLRTVPALDRIPNNPGHEP